MANVSLPKDTYTSMRVAVKQLLVRLRALADQGQISPVLLEDIEAWIVRAERRVEQAHQAIQEEPPPSADNP